MLSNSCRYGIRAVIYLANQPARGKKTGIKQISTDLDLPTPFLAKILQQLAKKKILSSSKGPHGGFSLLKDPKKILLIDIIKSIDGEDIFTNCIVHDGSCSCMEEDKNTCPLHEDYEKIRDEIVTLFSNTTIYNLVTKAHNSKLITI
jgi:Rrf2 family transcriptional regulator, iron-sulfur cluster assembly transcription factor